MNKQATIFHDLKSADLDDAIAAAAQTIDAGLLAVLPTHSAYFLACDATCQTAVANLLGPTTSQLASWYAPWPEALTTVIPISHRVHQRLIRRLCPGAIRWDIDLSTEQIEDVSKRLEIAPGLIDDGRALRVRVPRHKITQGVLEKAQRAVIGLRLDHAGLPSPHVAPNAVQLEALTDVACVLDDGHTSLSRPPTTVHLTATGGWDVADQGAIEERFISKQLERIILFVCTGNTCRSPMAQAIAQDLISKLPISGITTRAQSAGVMAGHGMPATPQAIEALARMDIRASPHASRLLTPELVAQADVIICMTASHLDAVRSMDPAANSKAIMLAPDGDIPDPVGSPLEVYISTAERIRDLVRIRLEEIEP